MSPDVPGVDSLVVESTRSCFGPRATPRAWRRRALRAAPRAWHRSALRAAALATLLLAAACGAPPLYAWGDYEESVLRAEQGFSDEALLEEIDTVEAAIESRIAHDARMPPGLHAHAGWLQYLAGNTDAARRHFEEEKALFPEATVFIDGLLRRME